MKKSLKPRAMREDFLSFLELNGHTRVRRYPVVARWREDVFYTQASIYPFQPWVIEGVASPPGNPLCISQPCVRFNDIDNVGKTGQHFTMFEMMAHHVFNFKDKFIYFKDRTVELCHQFLADRLGVDPKKITYKEAWWSGGGNSGPCFEVILGSAEVATLVFMVNQETNGSRVPMETQVVDTGYGLERLSWVSQGSPSAYEAVFGDVLAYLKRGAGVRSDERILQEYSKVAGMTKVESFADVRQIREEAARRLGISVNELMAMISPMESLYALCDHTRALCFMLADGVVPSNVKEGYFARLLVRRAARMMKTLDMGVKLEDIVSMQIEQLREDFPDILENRFTILKILDIEQKRYEETLSKGRLVVRQIEGELKASGRGLGLDTLIELYDSHGLSPEIVKEFTQLPLEIPDDFYAQVAKRHERPESEEKRKTIQLSKEVQPTKIRVYEAKKKDKFRAKIVAVEGDAVILDQSYFYPEGGGQEADHGYIGDLQVYDVQKVGATVLHLVRGDPKPAIGSRVTCRVDWERRANLMRNHTATHIVLGAARKVLGSHIWQAGAHKAEDVARLDVTHYASVSDEELERIEQEANDVVFSNLRIHKRVLPRNVAERKHGFRLYQGGCVPGGEIRVVEIPEWDTEACGGTHVSRTSEIGFIKMLRAKRIQDGVVRLEYVAGKKALEHVRRTFQSVQEISRTLRVPIEDIGNSVSNIYQEWKELRKTVSKGEKAAIRNEVEQMLRRAEIVDDVRIVVESVEGGMEDLVEIAGRILQDERTIAILGARGMDSASIVVGRSNDISIEANEIVARAAEVIGGKGGGRADFARGGGHKVEALSEALERARSLVKERLASGKS